MPYADAPRFELPERVRKAHAAADVDPGERAIAARLRRLISIWAKLPDRSITGVSTVWVREQTSEILTAWPMAKPSRMGRVDITGGMNVYRRHLAPPLNWRYIGERAAAEVTRTGSLLDPGDIELNRQVFHRGDRRLAWHGERGVVLDEIRVGPPGDDPLDKWMRRKVACDVTLGAAVADALNLNFAGVRILCLNAMRESVLATTDEVGNIMCRPLQHAMPETFTPPKRVTNRASHSAAEPSTPTLIAPVISDAPEQEVVA